MADVENDQKKIGVRGWRKTDRDRHLDIDHEGGQEPYTQWRERERYVHPLTFKNRASCI